MSLEPDAEHAARALEDVQRRRDQAIEAQRQPRWFSIAWGTNLFLVMGLALGLATMLQSDRQSERLKSLGQLGYAHDRS